MPIGILNHFLPIARSGKGSRSRWPERDRDWCFREASIVVGYHGHSCVTWVTASLKRHARSALTLIMQEFHAADSPRACHFYELQLYYGSITAVAPKCELWIYKIRPTRNAHYLRIGGILVLSINKILIILGRAVLTQRIARNRLIVRLI